jgi:hypothetical protein
LESWLLNICKDENINLVDFKLPPDLERLTEYTKSRRSVGDIKLRNCFKAINRKTENISIRKLKSWVTLLKDKNYKVDINDLING